MNKKLNIKLIFYFIIAIFIGIALVPKHLQNDTFTSILLGKNILQNGYNIKETLTYHTNFVFYNARWLFDIITASIYFKFGFFGLRIFVLLVSSIISVLLFGIGYKYTKKPKLCLILLFGALYYIRFGIACRAQIISIILFILQYYSSKELLKTNKKRYYFLLLVIPIILVNIHGTILPTFYIFYLPFVAEYILIKIPKIGSRFKGIELVESKYYKNLMIIILISLLEGFISPNGVFPYIMNFQAPIRFYSRFINELGPMRLSYLPLFLTYFVIFFINLDKPKAHETFMLFGLAIMGLIHIRCLIQFFLIGYIIVIDILGRIIDSSEYNFIEKIKNKKIIFNSILVIGIIACGFIFRSHCNNNYLTSDYPVQATQYLIDNIDLSKETLFNDFNVGSYLEFRGIKTFLDSRAELFVKPFNDTTILYDTFNNYHLKSSYEECKQFFTKYNFTIALIDKNSGLYSNIQENEFSFFKQIYEDDYFVIYRIEL